MFNEKVTNDTYITGKVKIILLNQQLSGSFPRTKKKKRNNK